MNGYKFEKLLGSGASGSVWLTLKLGIQYAVKIINSSERTAENEKEFADRWRFPCDFLVRYIDSFEDPSHPKKLFIVMEYCSRGNLRAVINDMKSEKGLNISVDVDRIMKIFIQTTIGLFEMHGRDIIHRDIKVENILIDLLYNAKIADFGFSRSIESVSQQTYSIVGTPGYMAPEIFVGRYGKEADIFALGAMMYHLCTFEMPFKSLKDLREGKYEPLPTHRLPLQLCELISSLLSPNPQDRPSAREILSQEYVQKFAGQFNLLSKFHPSIVKHSGSYKSSGSDSGSGSGSDGSGRDKNKDKDKGKGKGNSEGKDYCFCCLLLALFMLLLAFVVAAVVAAIIAHYTAPFLNVPRFEVLNSLLVRMGILSNNTSISSGSDSESGGRGKGTGKDSSSRSNGNGDRKDSVKKGGGENKEV